MSKDPLALPDRWLHCPKIGSTVENIFVPFKVPLDERFSVNIPGNGVRWEPKDVFNISKVRQLELGAVVDLTNSKRYYQPDYFKKNNIIVKKIACRGHGETPDDAAIAEFIGFCSKFRAENPHRRIGVHCTHGFNRTGFLICAYLVEQEQWGVSAAIGVFSKARKPGIYKQDYIEELFKRYGDPEEEVIEAPNRPVWDGNSRETSAKSASKAFMEGIPGVSFLDDEFKTKQVQEMAARLCEYKRDGFPGSQPVSLGKDNLRKLSQMPYKVSWKADGTRYMMLIAGPDDIYFLDRDNAVFKVSGLTFPYRKDPNLRLDRTLLDGEMVLDRVSGDRRIPRYLIYDIVHFRNDLIGKMNFDIRMVCIQREIIDARRQASQNGIISLADEPFALRKKEFFDIDVTGKILAEKFQSQVSHEIDGVIFQPLLKPYISGRCDFILKWKPPHLNSIDFLLKIETDGGGEGMLTRTRAALYVGGHSVPMDFLQRVTPEARALNGKIVECKYKENGWVIMRERTDKSFPNGFRTALGVWDSIRYPITEEILLEFIRDKAVKDVKPPPPAAASPGKRKADNDFAVPSPKRKSRS